MKYELVEGERNVLADNESKLEEKTRQLTSQLEVERMAAANAIEQLEQEQCDKRELQEQLNDLRVRKTLNCFCVGSPLFMCTSIQLCITHLV